jgi:hypothetical protein
LIGKAVEAGVSAVPIVGGPLAVVIATVFGYAYSKRIDRWREELTAAVQYLMDHQGVTVEDLADNDDFLDAVATASRIATATSSEDKRRRLRNALINIGNGSAPQADKQAIYLRYVDELTTAHMRLLDFMIDPPGYCERHGVEWPNIVAGGLNSIIEVALPDLAGDRPFLETLGSDLSRQGLIDNPGFYSMMSDAGLRAGRVTSKGAEFLAFLTSPLDAGD